jgi:hypothetical protein
MAHVLQVCIGLGVLNILGLRVQGLRFEVCKLQLTLNEAQRRASAGGSAAGAHEG